ncbi:hypothetical protein PL490_15615 [Phocaeicola vulgatus]|nr:hypothetical protein [Phocaeicola vulgatus]MDB0814903.1 hypothetical protein [Phocaeicola vulgatus]
MEYSKMERVTGQAGVNVYWGKINTEFRLHGEWYFCTKIMV